jgi:erythromycin esterase-like protein
MRLLIELREIRRGFRDRGEIALYGLDLYSLFDSIEEVLRYLDRIDPLLSSRVRARYSCFEPFARDEIAYVRAVADNELGCQ